MCGDRRGTPAATKDTSGPDDWGGKVVLVAGATRGLGQDVATRLATQEATVMMLPRSLEERPGVGGSLPGGAFGLLSTDLSKPTDLMRAIAHILDLGGVDVLINVAAPLDPVQPRTETEATTLERVFQFNVVVPADLSVSLLPRMVERGWGRIVNVSRSLPRGQTSAISEAYVASRHALETHTRNLAARLSGTGVTANAYRSGAVDPWMQVIERRRRTGSLGIHHRVVSYAHDDGCPPGNEAVPLLRLLRGDQTGKIWVADG